MGVEGTNGRALGTVLLSAAEIARRIEEIALELSRDYAGRRPILVGVLTGSVLFVADLIRKLDIDLELEFVAIASYGAATQSSGEVKLLKDLNVPMQGRDVIIVEDVVDTGLTLQFLLDLFRARHPLSVATCVLLDKPSRRQVDVPVDYRGFTIEDRFVVGYGLDRAGMHRRLPYVAVLEEAGNQPDSECVGVFGEPVERATSP